MVFPDKPDIGVDCECNIIRSVIVSPASNANSEVVLGLVYGEETGVWSDPAHHVLTDVIKANAANGEDFFTRRRCGRGVVDEVEQGQNRTKSRVPVKVEHAVGVIKRVFDFSKVRYRGLNNSANRHCLTFVLANLDLVRRHLCCFQGA